MRLPSVSVFRIFVSLLTLFVTAAVATVFEASPTYARRHRAHVRRGATACPGASPRTICVRSPAMGVKVPRDAVPPKRRSSSRSPFPKRTSRLALSTAARSAAARLNGKPFPHRQREAGHVGDDRAEQRALPASAVPHLLGIRARRYVAGGRATAIAIDPDCAPGHCRLWVFAAGGGVWRTKNALSGQPHWEYPLRQLRHPIRQCDHARSERPHRRHAVRRHGRSQRLGRFGRRGRHVQVDRRRRHLGQVRSALGLQRPGHRQHRRRARNARTRSTSATTRGVLGVSAR